MADTSFASLNPSLLARKGGAKPAMRPQAMAGVNSGLPGDPAPNLDDLGWNDMGDDDEPAKASVTQLTPAPSPEPITTKADTNEPPHDVVARKPVVHEQHDEIVRQFTNSAPEPKATQRVRGKRAAFTLRLDAERHLRLRLASTIQGRSAQIIVTEALDALLAKIPELESLAGQIHKEGT